MCLLNAAFLKSDSDLEYLKKQILEIHSQSLDGDIGKKEFDALVPLFQWTMQDCQVEENVIEEAIQLLKPLRQVFIDKEEEDERIQASQNIITLDELLEMRRPAKIKHLKMKQKQSIEKRNSICHSTAMNQTHSIEDQNTNCNPSMDEKQSSKKKKSISDSPVKNQRLPTENPNSIYDSSKNQKVSIEKRNTFCNSSPALKSPAIAKRVFRLSMTGAIVPPSSPPIRDSSCMNIWWTGEEKEDLRSKDDIFRI